MQFFKLKYKKIIAFTLLIVGFFSVIIFTYGRTGTQEELEYVFQKELDKEFKKVDEKIEGYLFRLNSQKDYCFGPNKKIPFTKCIDELEYKFGISGEYSKEYYKACSKSLEEVIKKQKDKSLSVKDSLTVLNPYKGLCYRLADEKLRIYKAVANDILKFNKYIALGDESKKMIQEDRTKYDRVLKLARIVLGDMGRMANKWPSKTKKHIE